jgi:hypothetical protein
MDKVNFDVSCSPHNLHNIVTIYRYDILNELVGYFLKGFILNVLSGLYQILNKSFALCRNFLMRSLSPKNTSSLQVIV